MRNDEANAPVDRRVRAIISNFLTMASEPLRVAKMGQGNKDGIISYELRIPPSLRNVVILRPWLNAGRVGIQTAPSRLR